MSLQSKVNFAEAVLPILAALLPKDRPVLAAVSDAIHVEQGAYSWFNSDQGSKTRENLQKLFSDLGVKTTFHEEGMITVSTVRDDSGNPNAPGFLLGENGE